MLRMLRSFTFISLLSSSSSGGLGSVRANPWSVSIEVVTRKKMSNMNDMSAVELVFRPGTFFLFPMVTQFLWLLLRFDNNAVDDGYDGEDEQYAD